MSGPSISRCMPCCLVALRTTNASTGGVSGVDGPLGRGRVQHGVGHRIRAQGQPADRRVLPVRGEHPQQPSDQRRGPVLEGDPAQVHVVVGLGAGGQRDPLVHHAELADQRGQLLALRVRGRSPPSSLDRGGDPPDQRARHAGPPRRRSPCTAGSAPTPPSPSPDRTGTPRLPGPRPTRTGRRGPRRRCRPGRGTRCARSRGRARARARPVPASDPASASVKDVTQALSAP